MNWRNILKDEESYSRALELIEKVELLLDKLHDDIEESAVDMSKQTGLSLEKARKLIQGIHKDTRIEIENTLKRYKKELPRHIQG
tara:strand:+ start:6777 stop:7031 length:255 start_codon:yes stop_codon:yes gene_type:complete